MATHAFINEWNEPHACGFPAEAGPHLSTLERWVGLSTTMVSIQSVKTVTWQLSQLLAV